MTERGPRTPDHQPLPGVHPADLFARRLPRLLNWELAAVLALAGSLGEPGLGWLPAWFTVAVWLGAFATSGCGHCVNAWRCRRRRSLVQGPAFAGASVIVVVALAQHRQSPWDDVFLAAFALWLVLWCADRRGGPVYWWPRSEAR